MAVVKMSSLRLTGLSSEKEKLLDALHKTRLVELRETPAEEGVSLCKGDEEQKSEIRAKFERTERCIAFLSDRLSAAKKKPYYPQDTSGLSDDIFIGYDAFMNAHGNETELMSVVERSETYAAKLAQAEAERAQTENLKAQLFPYVGVKDKFSDFKDTKYTRCAFGLIPEQSLENLKNYVAEKEMTELSVFTRNGECAVCVVAHIEEAEELFQKLGEFSFSKCPFDEPVTASEKIAALDKKLVSVAETERETDRAACGDSAFLRDLKVLSDWYALRLEKLEAAEKFTGTESTFTLRGYLPEEKVADVKNAVYNVTDAVYMEFAEPAEDETPPTLLKNRGPARAAEFVTNMYSAPDYREFDPNGAVFIFFMIFFGLIMADIGYGLLLLVGGAVIRSRIKVDNGLKKLACVLAYGGAFTMVFGALFGSLFGVALYPGVLPDPTAGRTNVLIVLLGCLALGLLQITVGYLLKAVNAFRQKDYGGAIFDSLTWVLFDIGLFFAVFNFITEYFEIPVAAGVKDFFSAMTLPGVIMLGTGLFVAVVTAGRKEKFLGKFTKGFGAVYGIINLLSDVLSYARLFGLMLSGMIIAQQFNSIGMSIVAAGGVGYVFGPVVMVIGHAFNLAMGVLGAYIHDCRLQYIEFFSKFYTGEGELFAPLGSSVRYIHFSK